MKALILFFISFYQVTLSPFLHSFGLGGCKYPESCSVYAKKAVQKYGVLAGVPLATKRILSCHPFAKPIPYQV